MLIATSCAEFGLLAAFLVAVLSRYGVALARLCHSLKSSNQGLPLHMRLGEHVQLQDSICWVPADQRIGYPEQLQDIPSILPDADSCTDFPENFGLLVDRCANVGDSRESDGRS